MALFPSCRARHVVTAIWRPVFAVPQRSDDHRLRDVAVDERHQHFITNLGKRIETPIRTGQAHEGTPGASRSPLIAMRNALDVVLAVEAIVETADRNDRAGMQRRIAVDIRLR